jgi:hypothetical protein
VSSTIAKSAIAGNSGVNRRDLSKSVAGGIRI